MCEKKKIDIYILKNEGAKISCENQTRECRKHGK